MTIVRALTAAVLAASAVAGGCLGGGSRADIATVPTAGVIVTVGGPASGPTHRSQRGAPPGRRGRLGDRSRRPPRPIQCRPRAGFYPVTITGHGPQANGLPMQPTPEAILIPHAAGLPLRPVVSIK
jgi:hypothetical protein